MRLDFDSLETRIAKRHDLHIFVNLRRELFLLANGGFAHNSSYQNKFGIPSSTPIPDANAKHPSSSTCLQKDHIKYIPCNIRGYELELVNIEQFDYISRRPLPILANYSAKIRFINVSYASISPCDATNED